jgi:hypothetical protein
MASPESVRYRDEITESSWQNPVRLVLWLVGSGLALLTVFGPLVVVTDSGPLAVAFGLGSLAGAVVVIAVWYRQRGPATRTVTVYEHAVAVETGTGTFVFRPERIESHRCGHRTTIPVRDYAFDVVSLDPRSAVDLRIRNTRRLVSEAPASGGWVSRPDCGEGVLIDAILGEQGSRLLGIWRRVLTSRFVIGASDPAGFRDAAADALHGDRDVTADAAASLPEIPDSTAARIPGSSPVSSILFHTALGLPLGVLGIGYGSTILRATAPTGDEMLAFTLGIGFVTSTVLAGMVAALAGVSAEYLRDTDRATFTLADIDPAWLALGTLLGGGLVLGVATIVPTIVVGYLGTTVTLLLLGDCLFLGPFALLLASAWLSNRG